jgi:hypothetical protein
MMVETIEKATLLDKVQSAYEHLNTLLATLSEEQKSTPGVNGSWSVKDNLAHITAWQDLLPARIQSWITGHAPVEFIKVHCCSFDLTLARSLLKLMPGVLQYEAELSLVPQYLSPGLSETAWEVAGGESK